MLDLLTVDTLTGYLVEKQYFYQLVIQFDTCSLSRFCGNTDRQLPSTHMGEGNKDSY